MIHTSDIGRTNDATGVTEQRNAVPFPRPSHDHSDCVAHAIETADQLCHEKGLRFTKLRRRVLELVWSSHKPVGAYDILQELNAQGRKAAPPTVYRALEFLIEAELVHRLDSLNAFVGCADPSSSHSGQFLICRSCRSVAELDDGDIRSVVQKAASDLGFSAVRQMLEIQGICEACQKL
jgi:Fur family zinc uptake transcriptional regulator